MSELLPIKRDLAISDWTHREKGSRYRVTDVTIPTGALADLMPEGELIVEYERVWEPQQRFSRLRSEWETKMRRYPQEGDGLAAATTPGGGDD